MTFGLFAVAALPLLIYLRWRRSGSRPLLFTLAGTLALSSPELLIWAADGPAMIKFALFASYSDVAALWRPPGMTAATFVAHFVAGFHFGLIPLAVLAALYVRGIQKEKVRLLPLAIVLAFVAVAAMGENREIRYILPSAIGLPLILAWNAFRNSPPARFEAVHFLGGVLIAVLACVPMVARPILGPILQAEDLEENLSHGKPAVLELATDGPDYNINTFQLARQIGYAKLSPVQLDTLVYDAIAKKTPEDGFRRISGADYVLFVKPQFATGPAWSRQFETQYRSYVASSATPVPQLSSVFEIFKVNKS